MLVINTNIVRERVDFERWDKMEDRTVVEHCGRIVQKLTCIVSGNRYSKNTSKHQRLTLNADTSPSSQAILQLSLISLKGFDFMPDISGLL